MNLILFEPEEIGRPLPRADARARHIMEVLRRQPGDEFDAGISDGPRGRGTLDRVTVTALEWSFAPGDPLPPLPTTALLIGLPRPQTARDILRDATTLGATSLHFAITARGDSNYAASSLWSTDEWRRCLCTGAAQAFDPRLPRVYRARPLAEIVTDLPAAGSRYALDNYEAKQPFAAVEADPRQTVTLALGPERGWDPADREVLRTHGFELRHLGPRVLRLETAVVAALTLLNARRGTA